MYNEGHPNNFLNIKHEEVWREKVLIPNLNEVQSQISTSKLHQEAKSLEDLQKLLSKCSLSIGENQEKVSLDIQFTIFHAQSGVFLDHVPKMLNVSKRQIYLASNHSDFIIANKFYVIPHLKPFFHKFGTYCFFCQNFFTSKGCQHRCKNAASCFACRRVFSTETTYTTLETKELFCNGQILPEERETCPKCNVTLYSKNCKEFHFKKVCRWGWKCPKCNMYQSRNRFFQSQKDIAEKHICGTRVCNFCGELQQKNHFCALQKPALKKEFTNLAFVFFEYSGYNPGKCKACYTVNNKCDECQYGYDKERPIVCSLLQEEKTRESFSSCIFYDDEIENKNSSVSKMDKKVSFLKKPYWPTLFKPELAPEGRKTRFAKRKVPYKSLHVFCKQSMSVVEKFLDYVLNSEFSNSTILAHGQDLFYIVQALQTNGFTPNVVKKHSQIMLVEEKNLGLRFVEIENYINLNCQKLSKEHHLPYAYFPFRWLQPRFYDYVGLPPTVDDFFCFEDSEADVEEKKIFCSSLPQTKSWVFLENLTDYVLKQVTLLAIGVLAFLHETFEAQIVLQTHLEPDQETFLLHPINPPIFTAPTYAFHLFLHFCKESSDIKSVKKEVYFRSSLGEVEYTSFLKWKYPNKNIIDSWSPFGQKDLAITRPDAFSSSEVWFYNGCFYHGHEPSECFFKSKANKEKQAEKRAEFSRKINLLKEKHQNLAVSTTWECQWRRKKRENPEIKYFLSKIYRYPPPQRLHPREAIRGGLNEVLCLHWSQDLYPDEELNYLDMNGFYAYIAMISQFPIGSYEVGLLKNILISDLSSFSPDNDIRRFGPCKV